MEEAGKTTLCSVLFMDIAEYSRESVAGQISLKKRFNDHLSVAIRDVPLTDRIVLDTGDGAAITFLGAPEDALKVALNLHKIFSGEAGGADLPLRVRMGINLGPVRMIMDINGQPNVVGDGVNVAQRIMGFAEPDQIFMSRSYYDAVSPLSDQYAGMFCYMGSRTDRHVREHEVYAIDVTGGQGDVMQEEGMPEAPGKSPDPQRTLWIVAAIAVLVLLAVVAVKLGHRPEALMPQEAQKAVAPPKAPEQKMTEPRAPEPEVKSKQEIGQPAAQEKIAAPVSQVRTPKKPAAVETPPAALVSIAVTPWGEIYLDGKMQGVSPPLTQLRVAAGKHEIEIRNTTFPAYTRKIEAKAGEEIKIRHRFTD